MNINEAYAGLIDKTELLLSTKSKFALERKIAPPLKYSRITEIQFLLIKDKSLQFSLCPDNDTILIALSAGEESKPATEYHFSPIKVDAFWDQATVNQKFSNDDLADLWSRYLCE